jgi:hypothetical protein
MDDFRFVKTRMFRILCTKHHDAWRFRLFKSLVNCLYSVIRNTNGFFFFSSWLCLLLRIFRVTVLVGASVADEVIQTILVTVSAPSFGVVIVKSPDARGSVRFQRYSSNGPWVLHDSRVPVHYERIVVLILLTKITIASYNGITAPATWAEGISVIWPNWYKVSWLFEVFERKWEAIPWLYHFVRCIIKKPPLVFLENRQEAMIPYTKIYPSPNSWSRYTLIPLYRYTRVNPPLTF